MNDSLGHDDQLGTPPGSGGEAGISQESGGQGRGRPEETVSPTVSFLGRILERQGIVEASFRSAGLVVKYCLLNVPFVLFGLVFGTISEGFNVTSLLIGIAASSAVWLGFVCWVTNTKRDWYVTAIRALGVKVKAGKTTLESVEESVGSGWQEPNKMVVSTVSDVPVSGSKPPRQLFDTEDLLVTLAAAGCRLLPDTAKLPVPRTA